MRCVGFKGKPDRLQVGHAGAQGNARKIQLISSCTPCQLLTLAHTVSNPSATTFYPRSALELLRLRQIVDLLVQ